MNSAVRVDSDSLNWQAVQGISVAEIAAESVSLTVSNGSLVSVLAHSDMNIAAKSLQVNSQPLTLSVLQPLTSQLATMPVVKADVEMLDLGNSWQQARSVFQLSLYDQDYWVSNPG
jgi:hypothetical protein